MSLTNDQVVEILNNITVMELISLTRHLEQQWGLKAEPVWEVPTNTPVIDNAPVVEQTEFTVTFLSFSPEKKMTLVKLVREVLGLGLLESKNLVESLPKTLKEGLTKAEADELQAKFTEAGAVVELR